MLPGPVLPVRTEEVLPSSVQMAPLVPPAPLVAHGLNPGISSPNSNLPTDVAVSTAMVGTECDNKCSRLSICKSSRSCKVNALPEEVRE